MTTTHMRKKPTFNQLARATLVASSIGPTKLPHVPPNGASFAITEVRDMAHKLITGETIGRSTQVAVQQTAGAAGIAPDVLEQMMAATVAQNSEAMRRMQEQTSRYLAAQKRTRQLQHVAMLPGEVNAQ